MNKMNKKLIIVVAAVVIGIVGCSKEEEKVTPDIEFSEQQQAQPHDQMGATSSVPVAQNAATTQTDNNPANAVVNPKPTDSEGSQATIVGPQDSAKQVTQTSNVAPEVSQTAAAPVAAAPVTTEIPSTVVSNSASTAPQNVPSDSSSQVGNKVIDEGAVAGTEVKK